MDVGSKENRRKEERTSVTGEVYVVVDTQPKVMGQMVEISATGMAFTFVDLDSVSQLLRGRELISLDVFVAGKGFLLRNVKARMVSAVDAPSANAISSLIIKRIGVSFVSLSISQQVQINALISRRNERAELTEIALQQEA